MSRDRRNTVRTVARKKERLAHDPIVQDLIGEVSTSAFADFVVNAFANKPDGIDQEDWARMVDLVFKAGKQQRGVTQEEQPENSEPENGTEE